MRLLFITIILILPIFGCSVVQIGYLPNEPDLSTLVINATTYKQSITKFGHPAMSQISPGKEIHSRYLFSTPDSKIDNIKIMKGNYTDGCIDCGSLTLSFEWKESLNKSILAALAIDTPAMNKQHEIVISLLSQNKFKQALPLITDLANNHHTQSQYILGLMYIKGDGVQINFAKAYSLFKNAAINGHARAYYDLGAMYKNGEGMEIDLEMAKFCYQNSAERKYPLAAYELAKIYSHEGNKEKANSWFEKAKKLGYIPKNEDTFLF